MRWGPPLQSVRGNWPNIGNMKLDRAVDLDEFEHFAALPKTPLKAVSSPAFHERTAAFQTLRCRRLCSLVTAFLGPTRRDLQRKLESFLSNLGSA